MADEESRRQAPTAGGMSRAAKKRAKKKKKQSKKSNTGGGETTAEAAPNSNKKRPLDQDDDDDAIIQKATKQQGRKKPKQPKEDDSDESRVDDMIQSILSKLNPLQILQVTELHETEQEATIEGESVNVADLLQETTIRQRARALFQSILGSTVSLKEFYDDYWEQKPLYISADDDSQKTRLDGILSKVGIQTLIETQPTYYGKDLNVTRYEEGPDGVKRRITLDPQSNSPEEFVLVDSKDAWANYESGCSLRLLCPHKYNDVLHALLSTLEWEWGCMVGANVYLTPPGASQGFAPHYDDIEAFILQLEGCKHWKVYAPLNKRETLARTSSPDYTEEDLKGVEPVLDVVLKPGDVLYMPRGWIHQACTTPGKQHSLHLTISAMQQWSWADYLELLMPEALEAAASNTSTSLREGLPLRFLDYMGAVYDDANDSDLPDGLKNVEDGSKKEESADDEDEDGEKTLRARQMKRLREEFREEAKKRIMRVSKEVRPCTQTLPYNPSVLN